jgi:hypothetical protein
MATPKAKRISAFIILEQRVNANLKACAIAVDAIEDFALKQWDLLPQTIDTNVFDKLAKRVIVERRENTCETVRF